MRRVPVLLAVCLAMPAGAVEYNQLLPAQGRIAFVSKQMGVPVDGLFKRYTAQLAFDPARPEAGRASLDIDLASIDAPREVYDDVVGKNWFNVRQFPRAQFQSSAVRALGGSRYEVRGPLTIKGRTREVAAPFTFTATGKTAVFEGGFTLKRLEFGIGEGEWGDTDTVADEVQVKFRFVAGQAAPTKSVPAKPVPAASASPAKPAAAPAGKPAAKH